MSKTAPVIRANRASDGLALALLLGFALLLLSYVRLAGYINTAAFNAPKVLAETLTEPLLQTRLGLNIVVFGVVQLLLHLSFGALCWMLARACAVAWPRARPSRRQWILIWFLLGAVWLLVANASHFPRSSLGAPYQVVGEVKLFGITPYALLSTALATGVAATLILALLRTVGPRWLAAATGGSVLLLAVIGFGGHAGGSVAIHAARPNVILLGIDSLRPDVATHENAPHMREFLDHSLQLTEVVTPLARTFPSWVSILTGRHPHATGAFMNLLPRALIHEGRTLPAVLREQGYRTVYAIDETRFSNIDASYGFDQTETPGIGGSDFVLTWFADTPLSNVLVNTRLGSLLFPFQYANRAAFVTYEPDSFVQRIDRALDAHQPLFLALHLTLPHWPFEWADSRLPQSDDGAARRWKYLNTVRRADQQFGDLLDVLERKGLLANTVVVALSDHGETFSDDDNSLAAAFPDEDEASFEAQLNGHGTSVFSPGQYHTVLGFRAYGNAAPLLPAARRLTDPASLLDITPTILDLLRLPAANNLDGDSLLPLFNNQPGAATHFGNRIRFTESEYNPTGFNVDKMTTSAIAAAAMVYRVDPRTDRLNVRPDGVVTILATRQYAALLGGTLAAAVPSGLDDGLYRFVYMPPRGGKSDDSQQARLRQALEERFSVRFAPDKSASSKPKP